MTVVVLPTPPFWFASAIILATGVAPPICRQNDVTTSRLVGGRLYFSVWAGFKCTLGEDYLPTTTFFVSEGRVPCMQLGGDSARTNAGPMLTSACSRQA